MLFENEDELQYFIARFFNEHGDTAQREIVTEKGRIDILTSRYLIECKLHLSYDNLYKANGQLARYCRVYPGHQPVIAGLCPKSGEIPAANLANGLREDGICVWFIDQEPDFVHFYNQLYASPAYPSWLEFTNSDKALQQQYPNIDINPGRWGFVTIILITIAGMLLTREPPTPIQQLHQAARAWDLELAKTAIHELRTSEDQCERLLGGLMDITIQGNDITALNMVQGVQTYLANTYQCSYPPVLGAPEQLPYESIDFQ